MKKLCVPQFSELKLLAVIGSLAILNHSCNTLDQNKSLAIAPAAEKTLRSMSEKLASSQQFSFHTSRTIDAALVLGTNINETAHVDTFVSRPNKIKMSMITNQGRRELLYDGSKVFTFNQKRNEYASEDAPSTIDGVIDSVSGDWGVRPPLSDILVSDPYRSLTHEGGLVQHIDSEMINGVLCDHLQAKQQSRNWDLWVAQKDQLPRKLVITHTARDGSPQTSSKVSKWNLSPNLSNDIFTIDFPKNARKTSLIRSH